ncbi:MAG: AAA family ATPase [Candidatus Bathyarchaeia archaeon]
MIKGVILKNFMSYEDAYVPLREGLNIICGPNGAGKSSILLAISVVLGQAYTERSKRLSDLIRWGEDQAVISLLIDNSPREGKRPFPQYKKDVVTITRILRRSGDYSYLLEDRPVPKEAIVNALEKFGLNPNNMLIIMQQLMVTKFGLTSPQEKLRMLEEAIGFQSYRSDVMEALRRLKAIESEEEELARVLQSAEETYEYWRREYQRYLAKRELEDRLRDLRRELIWSKITKKRGSMRGLEEGIQAKRAELEGIDSDIIRLEGDLASLEVKMDSLRERRGILRRDLMWALRREGELSKELEWVKNSIIEAEEGLAILGDLEAGGNPPMGLLEQYMRSLKSRRDDRRRLLELSRAELEGLLDRRTQLEGQMEGVEGEWTAGLERLVDLKVRLGILKFRREMVSWEIRDLELQLRRGEEELRPLLEEAKRLGEEFLNPRRYIEIVSDISALEERLKPLKDVSEDVQRAYESYSTEFKALKERAERVYQSKRELEAELKRREERWRSIVGDFVSTLSKRYDELLQMVNGSGRVRLVRGENVEGAGLEISAGFRGVRPTPLDSLTQSGGERSLALISFLLALQQHIRSPFRGIDEFDVHLDPRNREEVSKLIVSSLRGLQGVQYIVITPGQVRVDRGVHVIVVQNVGGVSRVGLLEGMGGDGGAVEEGIVGDIERLRAR